MQIGDGQTAARKRAREEDDQEEPLDERLNLGSEPDEDEQQEAEPDEEAGAAGPEQAIGAAG